MWPDETPGSIVMSSFEVYVSSTTNHSDGVTVPGIPGSPPSVAAAGPAADIAEWSHTYTIVS